MSEAFVVGGLGFWFVSLVWLFLVWLFSENEHGFLGFVSTILYLVGLQLLFKVGVYDWAVANHGLIIALAMFYLFIGAAWCFWRWYLFAKDQYEPYKNMKTEWLISKRETQFNDIPERFT